MPFVSFNPATGKRLAVYPGHTAAQLERIVARAAAGQRAWRDTPVAQRARIVAALGRELRRRRDALAALATDEMGKPIAQARSEVEKCATLCDFYARHGAALLADEVPVAAPPNTRVAYEPLGTVLAIMPWNFPFWQVVRAAVPTLLAGNAVLLKHAPSVPGCALALERVFAQAGIPREVFRVVLIDTKPVPRLLADRRIHAVTLTGSTRAGKAVAAQAGAAMKPGVYELGGSDPVIVLEDADLDRAAELATTARLINSGQSCLCGKRIIVVRAVRREFEAKFVARMAARRLGDPANPATDIGPLARADLRDALHRQVTASVRAGAKLLLGGRLVAGPGFFYPATVLTDVRPGMAAADEELFGPAAAILVARDADDAIRLANATRFGLGAALFTRNLKRARKLVARIEAGAVFVNDFARSTPELPFGGIKESGYGRELGAAGLRAFTNAKTIWGA